MSNEMAGDGIQPAPPIKSTVASDALEKYFESIEEPFRETRKGLANDDNNLESVVVIVFIFSLIPLLPYLVSKLLGRIVGPKLVSLGIVHFQLSSFGFWWVALFTLSLASVLLSVKVFSVSAKVKKGWLSPAQMRFAYCFGVVTEIRKYRTNQLERHIDTALAYLDKTANSVLRTAAVPIDEGFYPDQYWRREMQLAAYPMRPILGSPPKWYRLRPETELILKAFNEFIPKLRDRLEDRKDLVAIENVLTDLATYHYLEIPELSDSKSEIRFEEGMESLESFAQQVISLASYRSEQLRQSPEEEFSQKIFSTVSKMSVPFMHENPLVAFLSWFALLFLLFLCGFLEALRLFPMKIDSTIITTLVAGPILGAVTAVTIPRVRARKKNDPD